MAKKVVVVEEDVGASYDPLYAYAEAMHCVDRMNDIAGEVGTMFLAWFLWDNEFREKRDEYRGYWKRMDYWLEHITEDGWKIIDKKIDRDTKKEMAAPVRINLVHRITRMSEAERHKEAAMPIEEPLIAMDVRDFEALVTHATAGYTTPRFEYASPMGACRRVCVSARGMNKEAYCWLVERPW